MYWPEIGRFVSADSYLEDPANPASLNRYSYVHNNPYKFIDPTGNDAIPVVFPDFRIATPAGRVGGLGHAGIILVNSTNGATRYYEYGRYDEAGRGEVRRRSVPDVTIGRDGRPTPESMERLLAAVSRAAGHSTRVEGAYVENDNYDQMVRYAEQRLRQNGNPERESYGLFGNNCASFMQDVLEAGGVDTPAMVDPRPNSYIGELQDDHPRVQYNPAALRER